MKLADIKVGEVYVTTRGMRVLVLDVGGFTHKRTQYYSSTIRRWEAGFGYPRMVACATVPTSAADNGRWWPTLLMPGQIGCTAADYDRERGLAALGREAARQRREQEAADIDRKCEHIVALAGALGTEAGYNLPPLALRRDGGLVMITPHTLETLERLLAVSLAMVDGTVACDG